MMVPLLIDSTVRSVAFGAVLWSGLRAFGIRNPYVQRAVLTLVLAVSLAMPMLMRMVSVTIPLGHALPIAVTAVVGAPSALAPAATVLTSASGLAAPPVSAPISWYTVVDGVYLAGVGLMLLRLLVGLALTWRIARRARPLDEVWAEDVRISAAVQAPVTFGSTILLPLDYARWPTSKRRAVLGHEYAHVVHGDFYIQTLAALNRAVFWFNPLAWWLQRRLADLAETASDLAAIEVLGDRPTYAKILLDIATTAQPMSAAVAMARPATVAARVKRILTERIAPTAMTARQRTLMFVGLVPLMAFTAGCSVRVEAQDRPQVEPLPAAAPMGESSQARSVAAFDAVEVDGSWKVDITAGQAQSVVVFGDKEVLDHILTEVDGHSLRVHLDDNEGLWRRRHGEISVRITVPHLSALALNGSNSTTVTGLAGGSTAVAIRGSGGLRAQGAVDHFALDISGSGSAKMPDLTVNDAAIDIKGSGSAQLHVVHNLAVNIKGSGSVHYTGSPTVASSIRGSGSVQSM